VFLRYWGGSRRTFAPVIASLSSGRTVVVYDQRGWGAVRDLPGPDGISQLADDVLDVIRELEIGRYVVVGHSMGGKVAQLAASRNLERRAGVVLVAPAPPRPTVDTDAAQRHIANARIGAYRAGPPHHACAHECSSEGVRSQESDLEGGNEHG
jgi:pimeloyl-ACP methyl ester carboxylesterase